MKIKSCLTAVMMLCLGAFAAAQDDSPWRVVFFPPGDPSATESVNQLVREGYMPVGMEVTPGESLAILLVRAGSRAVESWAILDYDDWNALEAEITGGIADGFVPMDISRYGDGLAILWVKTILEIDGWRVSTSGNSIGDRTRTVNEFQELGFTLWGLSVYEDLVWYLFLRTPGMPPAGAVSGYRKDSSVLQTGIVDASRDGWLPNGMAIHDDTIYICFVR